MRRTALAGLVVTATAMLSVLAALETVAAEGVKRERLRGLTQAYNLSGQKLFTLLSKQGGNIVMSPYSIGAAMAMALAGSRGDTEREMAAVLAHTLDRAGINDANAAAIGIFNSYDRSHVPPICPRDMRLQGERCEAKPAANGECPFPGMRDKDVCVAPPRFPPSAKLLVANALMLGKGNVAKDYAVLLRDRYSAEIFPGATLESLNAWVSKRTEGKIPKLLDKMSDLVLVNAVYFKSRWAVVFEKKRTQDEFFNLSRSRQELVPTMLQRANHAVVTREGYRAIRLRYSVRELALVVVLPNEVEGLPAVAARLDAGELGKMLNAFRGEMIRPVILTLPRFRVEFSASLVEHFQLAGMRLAFDADKADFSGMTTSPVPVAIDQIVHRAVLEVAEESTEAAAATGAGAVLAGTGPPPAEPMSFRVDRPFLFYLVDDATGAVLFQGRMVDPR